MEQSITIDADNHLIKAGTYSSSMPVEKLYNKVVPLTPSLGMLPAVVKYISPINAQGKSLVVVERRIGFLSVMDKEKVLGKYRTPWQHLFIYLSTSDKNSRSYYIDDIRVAFSASQINGLEHEFFPAFCLGLDFTNDPVLGKMVVGRVGEIPIGDGHGGAAHTSLSEAVRDILYQLDTTSRVDIYEPTKLVEFFKAMYPDVWDDTLSFEDNFANMQPLIFSKENNFYDALFAFLATDQFRQTYGAQTKTLMDIIVDWESVPAIDLGTIVKEITDEIAALPPLPTLKKLTYKQAVDHYATTPAPSEGYVAFDEVATNPIPAGYLQSLLSSSGTAEQAVQAAHNLLLVLENSEANHPEYDEDEEEDYEDDDSWYNPNEDDDIL